MFAGIVTGVTFTSATTPSVAVNSLATPSSSTVYLAPSFISANVSRVTLEASALSGVTLLTAIAFWFAVLVILTSVVLISFVVPRIEVSNVFAFVCFTD